MPQRIAREIDGFNPYIINTNTYMLAGTPTNWSRLGWLQAEMTQWTGFVTQWTPLYAKYSDKKGSRTTAITDQLHLIIKQCIGLDKSNHLLDRIAASPNVTILDLETFHIKKGVLQDNTHTQRHAEVADALVVDLQSVGGGDIAVKCRTSHDSKRSSIADGADCVQYAFQIGGTAPASADITGLKVETSSHAAFTLHLGSASSGKTLFIFFRWYNTKHPALASHWNAMQTILVL
jgi:hypothetical protein